MPKVTVKDLGETIEFGSDQTVLQGLQKNNIFLKSSCGGKGVCGECKYKFVFGEDHLTPPSGDEIKMLGNVFHITHERLACQSKVTGDVTIELGESNITKKMLAIQEASAGNHKTAIVRKRKGFDRAPEDKKIEMSDEQKKDSEEEWFKHWEKECKSSITPVKKGGGRRPKFFKTADDLYDREEESVVEKVPYVDQTIEKLDKNDFLKKRGRKEKRSK